MSKDNPQVNGSKLNNDAENSDGNCECNYFNKSNSAYENQNRICCSPTEEVEAMQGQKDYNLCNTQSVEVQTEKSALHFLKQDKKVDDNKKNDFQVIDNETYNNKRIQIPLSLNESESIKLMKQKLNHEDNKGKAKVVVNIDAPQIFDKYTETDLDQPMDYTICFDEINSDEEKKGNSSYLVKNNFLCTDETIGEDKTEAVKPKGAINKEASRNKKEMFSNTGRSFKEIFNFFKDRDKKRSLIDYTKASIIASSKSLKSTECYGNKTIKLPQTPQLSSEQCEKERRSKNETQCSQQSPLMFSRCSSLGSLNGLEQNSINDDRSSIVSDFSLRTSGAVSPSELPDSPAPITSPAPKPQLKLGYFGKKKIQQLQDKIKNWQNPTISNENFLNNENNFRKLPIAKQSVFEDNLTAFKDESTPTKLDSVAASSLSSLTIDDDDDYELVNKIIVNKEKQNPIEDMKVQGDTQEPIRESNLVETCITSEKNETTFNEQDENLDGENDDKLTDLTPYEEKLLDECVRRGIAKWTKRNIDEIKPFSWDLGLTCRTTRDMLARNKSNKNMQNNTIEEQRYYNTEKVVTNNNNSTLEQNNKSKFENVNHTKNNLNEDQIKEVPNCKNTNTHLTENSYYMAYEEHLLDECIRRGMAKITKRNINDIKPFSWDKNQICLTTRAMILHGHDNTIYSSY